MFKNTLSIKDFSDLSRKNYVFDNAIPANAFSRLSHFLIDPNQSYSNQISINLEFFTEQSVDPKVKGKISSSLTMQCQRCLGPIEWQTETSVEFLLIQPLSQNKTGSSSVNTIAINSDGSRNANYAYNGIDLVGCLLERRGKNLPPGAVRSAPGDGILCSVHARSESSRLTDHHCYLPST